MEISQLVNSLNNVKDLLIMVVNNGNGQEFNNNFNKIEKLNNILVCNIKTNRWERVMVLFKILKKY